MLSVGGHVNRNMRLLVLLTGFAVPVPCGSWQLMHGA